jgi:hypothetical protein
MTECKIRKVYWHSLSGWQADCACGFTSGEKASFCDAMEAMEKHWNRTISTEEKAA